MAEQPAVTFYREGDADPDGLSGQTIAVVGYGNLGRSMALNLRDSGLTVTVGNVDDDYRATAQADGFEVSGVGVSVERDATGKAKARLLGLAGAAGSLRRGALELTAAKEALLDLFVEQGFGAYLGVAMQSAFQVGTQAGLPAEAMVVELYMSGEMARTLQAFADNGFFKSVTWHGLSAAYGGFLRTTEIDMAAMQRHFGEILADIQSGGFARRFQDEQANGYPTLAAIQSITSGQDPMTKAEERVREALAPEPDQAGQRP